MGMVRMVTPQCDVIDAEKGVCLNGADWSEWTSQEARARGREEGWHFLSGVIICPECWERGARGVKLPEPKSALELALDAMRAAEKKRDDLWAKRAAFIRHAKTIQAAELTEQIKEASRELQTAKVNYLAELTERRTA